MKIWNLATTTALLIVAATFVPNILAQEIGGNSAVAPNQDELVREALPQVAEGRFSLPDLQPPSTRTDNIGNGRVPDGFRGQQDPPLVALPESANQRLPDWNWSVINWSAPNTFSNPRYYEDRMLERHGHEKWGLLQPVAGGVRFFTTVPMWPYLAALRHPCDCEYTLGYYRPGTCAPALWQRPPCDRAAVLTQATVIAGVIIGFP